MIQAVAGGLRQKQGVPMRGGMMLGILGVIFGLMAAALGLLAYILNGTDNPHNPYAPRLWLGLGAFVLALLIGVGASLLRARPDIGAALMTGGSIVGTLALSAFNAGPTSLYAVSVPLCLLGAFLAVRQATPTPAIVALRFITLLLLAAGVVAGFYFGGFFGAVGMAVPFLIAAGLALTATQGGQA